MFPNTPFVYLCHPSATAPLVTFMYFSFAVPQNASQAVAGLAVIKHVTHTVLGCFRALLSGSKAREY